MKKAVETFARVKKVEAAKLQQSLMNIEKNLTQQKMKLDKLKQYINEYSPHLSLTVGQLKSQQHFLSQFYPTMKSQENFVAMLEEKRQTLLKDYTKISIEQDKLKQKLADLDKLDSIEKMTYIDKLSDSSNKTKDS